MLSRPLLSSVMLGWSAMPLSSAAPVMVGEPLWTAPPAEKGKPNPVPCAEGLTGGKTVFETNCGMCHGPTGKGDGPVGAALTPKAEDLTARAVRAQTYGALFWKISTGRGAMPSWQTLPEKDRWSVVAFIRSLGGK
jgi:mono/diheme cytochrome c family protein